ncbi:hypothetical protein VTI74DRAFT_11418 [Chaetomium olivicolor]
MESAVFLLFSSGRKGLKVGKIVRRITSTSSTNRMEGWRDRVKSENTERCFCLGAGVFFFLTLLFSCRLGLQRKGVGENWMDGWHVFSGQKGLARKEWPECGGRSSQFLLACLLVGRCLRRFDTQKRRITLLLLLCCHIWRRSRGVNGSVSCLVLGIFRALNDLICVCLGAPRLVSIWSRPRLGPVLKQFDGVRGLATR